MSRAVTLNGERFTVVDDLNAETVAYTGADGCLLGYARQCTMTDQIDIRVCAPSGEESYDTASITVEDGETMQSVDHRVIAQLLTLAENWRTTMKPFRISRKLWISLEHDDTYETHEGGDTDEGFDVTHTTYERNGNTIMLQCHRDAKDCDGRLQTYHEMHWPINGPLTEYGYPQWVLGDTEITDHTAIAAGY